MGCSEIGAPSTVPLTAPSRTWFSTVSTAGTPAPGAAGAAATGATAGAGAATGATCRGTVGTRVLVEFYSGNVATTVSVGNEATTLLSGKE